MIKLDKVVCADWRLLLISCLLILSSTALAQAGADSGPSLTICGSTWHQRLRLQFLEVEQAMRGGYSFNEACRAHDACYKECGSLKAVCDARLLTNAERVCETASNRGNCFADAQLFYMAVSEKGDGPFRQAQASCQMDPALMNPTSVAVESSLGQNRFAPLLAAAEAGDPYSQLRAGVAYAAGDGVRVNGIEAVRWLESAVASNGKIAAAAASWLGVVYVRGMGVRKSGETAVRWYTRGAELGAGRSARNLGEMYTTGRLVTKNEKLGYEWYARAAKLYEAEVAAGDTNAAYFAALIYHQGTGVSPNPAKAIALLEVASVAGNAEATKMLNEIRAQPSGIVAAAPANPASGEAETLDELRPSATGRTSETQDDVNRFAMTFLEQRVRSDPGIADVAQMKIIGYGPSPLTAADRLNGITGNWCVSASYVRRLSAGGRWDDHYGNVVVVRGQQGLKGMDVVGVWGKKQHSVEREEAGLAFLDPCMKGLLR